MPSTRSSSLSSDLPSSTVITPSLPTLSIASEMILPMLASALAEIAPTWAISFVVVQGLEIFFSSSTTATTALSMPRFRSIGFMPEATNFMPSRTMAWARTVAVVVPSPATSEVLEATSFTICAPMFSNLSFSSISFATETPSLVTVGAPNERSSTTLRPLGPSVTFTASARMFNPWTILVRAPSWKRTSFAGIVAFSCIRNFAGGLCAFDDAQDVFLAYHEELVALHLHGLPGVLAEQHSVAGLDIDRNQFAVIVLLALAHGDDLALLRLLGGGVRNDDASGGFLFLFDALDDHAVMQRTDFHDEIASLRGILCNELQILSSIEPFTWVVPFPSGALASRTVVSRPGPW